MAGLYEGQESPKSSPEVWPDYSGLSVEDVTRPQEPRLPEPQEFTSGLLLENLTLEDVSHDPVDDMTHRFLDRLTHPSLVDRGTMNERGQQNLMATLPVVGYSQAAGNDRGGPMQPVVGRMVRSRVEPMKVSPDSSSAVQRGLGSVAEQSHVFSGTQIHENLRPSLGPRLPDTPSLGGPLKPRLPSPPSLVVPQKSAVSSWGVPQGPSLANWNSSTQILPTSSRDSTGFLLRDQTPHQEGPRRKKTKFKLYSELKYPLHNGSRVDIFPSSESGLFKKGEYPYVCENFLEGTCRRASACPFYHALLPFHWQFHIKENDTWCSVPLGTQMHLEMVHAEPNFKIVPILYDDKIQHLDMKNKKFLEKDHRFDFVRRLTCKSNSSFAPPMNTYRYYCHSWVPQNKETENLTTDQLRIIFLPKYVPLYQNVDRLRIWFSDYLKNRPWWGEEPTDTYVGVFPCRRLVESMDKEDKFSVVEMVPSEPAYKYCCQLFHTSVPPEDTLVLKIYRYYSPRFWNIYQKEKRRLKTLRLPSPLEHHLFYQGNMTLESLTRNGLCPMRRSGEGMLGRGLYFSLNPYITSSHVNPQCGHLSVLAKVLVGEKTLGHPVMLSPPCKANGQEYDCCVNDMNMPTLFNVFRKELAYPYFIIFYRRLTDKVHLP